ncbi:MAG: MBL fold metallo-hydrolase [Rikenellaceae bacterium]
MQRRELKITLTLLGTGTSQGVPMVGCGCEVCTSSDVRDRRLRCSAMVEIEVIEPLDSKEKKTVRVIIDAGPDFRYQMLREGIKEIDGIILTHSHKDHIGGIDDVRAFNYWQRKPAEIYCEERVAEVIRKDFDYAFVDPEKKYAGVPEINLNIIDPEKADGGIFRIEGVEITPIRVMHHRLPIVGFKIGGLCYITDANFIDEASMSKIKGCDTLVLNALRHTKHISHFTLTEALEIARLTSPRQTYLTHCSHQMGLYKTISKELPHSIHFGYDNLKIISNFVELL